MNPPGDQPTPESTQATAAIITRTAQGFMVFWRSADGVWYSRRVRLGRTPAVAETTYRPDRVYGRRDPGGDALDWQRVFYAVLAWSPLAWHLIQRAIGAQEQQYD